eukprot:TRINITY_DN32661_c0_g1_i1.p1 TRINITY_DN32661_c0_g1~~TRINITY_DN32661_c0_g1_i1.p1  ORF type:complete len:298 (-),score=52.55 TRINITY_DN32661_c0_g1_i1:159-965(-)
MVFAHEANAIHDYFSAGPCLGLRGSKKVVQHAATAFSEEAAKDEGKKEGEEGGGACFPPTASVYVKGRGPVPIVSLERNDELLCGDADSGALFFSTFAGYLHSDPLESMACVSVRTRHSSIELVASREHLVFAADTSAGDMYPIRAELLRQGHWIQRVGCDGALQRVEVEAPPTRLTATGRYAPLTQRGTVVVDGVLCSCYIDSMADSAPAWLRLLGATHSGTHGLLLPLRLAARFGLKGSMTPKTPDGLDIYCKTLLRISSAIQAIA